MIIGHLPLGYLSTKLIAAKWLHQSVNKRAFMVAGILGSITPDLDMFYFYLIDNCQHHHHTYWTHTPLYWILILGLLFLVLRYIKIKCLSYLGIYGLNIFIHLVADTFVGDIWWLSPIINEPFSFFTVPSAYKTWWLNFVLHWSFLLEITIMLSALYLLLRSRCKRIFVYESHT